MAADSVIHCGDSRQEIAQAIRLALSQPMQQKAASTVNPYAKPDTLDRIVDALTQTPLEGICNKKFHDVIPLD